MLSIGCLDFVGAYIYYRYVERNSETGHLWGVLRLRVGIINRLLFCVVTQQYPLVSLIPGWHQTSFNKPFYISFGRVSYVQQRVNYRMKSETTTSFILGLKQPKTTTPTNETHVLWRSEKFMQVCRNCLLSKRFEFSCLFFLYSACTFLVTVLSVWKIMWYWCLILRLKI